MSQAAPTAARRRWLRYVPQKRRGAIIVLAAFLIVPILGMLAFSIDIGYIANVQTELKRTADAGALAGAGEMVNGTDVAQATALQYVTLNRVGSRDVTGEDASVTFGSWNESNRTFTPGGEGTAIRVAVQRVNQPLFFGRIFGRNSFSTQAESIATFRPRDIMIVLDYSGSMNDDSELKSYATLGRATVDNNIQDIYAELGSPTHGTLPYTPQYVTIRGQPASGNIPHCTVRFEPNQVYVTSTKDLSNVVLRFSNGNTQKFEGLSGRTGTFRGTGSNSGRAITRVWVKSGSNFSNDGPGYGERFEDTNAEIKAAYGLSSYPYPGGSWDDYINYVKSSRELQVDYREGGSNESVDYRKMYGYVTWINYLLEKRASYDDTPVLWQTSEQPIAALKDSVAVFFDYLEQIDTSDRVGLAVYNSPSQDSLLESPLTDNYAYVENISRQRQAGHYADYTNIGAGLRKGREQLLENGRPGAQKMVVLMTDGLPNTSSSGLSPRDYLLQQAQLTAAAGIPVVCISLGAGADADVMNQVAQMTEGKHFRIPGGQTGAEYREDLLEVFRAIADERPLKLVK